MKAKLLTLPLLFITFLSCFSQTADDIIAKHITATGGIDKWSKVVSIKYSGVYVMGPGMQAPVTSIMLSKPFKGYYSDFSWQGMTSKQAMRGDSGWSYNPFGGKRQADPLTPNDIRELNLYSDPQGLLLNYKEKGFTAEYLGMDDMDGSDVHKLRLTNKAGDMVYYYIDAESYYLLKVVRKLRLKDKEEKSYTVYSDFRKTDYGIVVPFSVQGVDEDGNEQGGPTNYSKVEVNFTVDPVTFNQPK
ncbi:MAG: hypothetical protein U0V74_02225 [Chitinophagales bacterium]